VHTDVVIVGAGIAGLACGVELARSDLGVTVLEAGPTLGGRARSWTDQDSGDVIDIGPHILLSEYHNMLRLMDDLGTRDNISWQAGKFITFVDEPKPTDIRMRRIPAPFHVMPSLISAPQVSLLDLASNYKVLWEVTRMGEDEHLELDGIDAERHLRDMGVTERCIDWFWRSACMSIMNVPLEKCSAGALLRFFRFMMGVSGYQVGFAATGLGDLFAPGAARLIHTHRGRVLPGTAVNAVLGTDGAATGVQLADGTTLAAAMAVICAVPPQALTELLPRQWQDRHQVFGDLGRLEPSPYVSTYLWFDRKLTDEKFWARVWAPGNLNYDSYDLSNIRPDWAGRPSLIASNIIHSHEADGLSDAEIIAITLRELGDYLPEISDASLLHSRVHRIPMAVPAPYPGTERLRPPVRSPIESLYLAGDWIQTGLPPSMESAVRAGYLAAEAVLEKLGRARTIAIDPPAATGLVRLVGGG
jgi:squalene-associated FAD-dependent desaturase